MDGSLKRLHIVDNLRRTTLLSPLIARSEAASALLKFLGFHFQAPLPVSHTNHTAEGIISCAVDDSHAGGAVIVKNEEVSSSITSKGLVSGPSRVGEMKSALKQKHEKKKHQDENLYVLYPHSNTDELLVPAYENTKALIGKPLNSSFIEFIAY